MAKKKKSNEYDIRSATVRALLKFGYQREDIRIEIPLDSHSYAGRADIVLLSDKLRCIELKSGRDKYTKESLKDQRRQYRTFFDDVGAIVDKSHYREEELSSNWDWDIIAYDHDHKDFCYTFRGGWLPYEENFLPQLFKGYNGRAQASEMSRILWLDELKEIFGKCQKCERISHIREYKTLHEMRPLIIKALRSRPFNRWEEKFWKAFDEENNEISNAS